MRAAWALAWAAVALTGKAPPGDELLRARSQSERPPVAGLRDEERDMHPAHTMSEDHRRAREAAEGEETADDAPGPHVDERAASDDEMHETHEPAGDDETHGPLPAPQALPAATPPVAVVDFAHASFAALAAAARAAAAAALEARAAVEQSPESRKYALYGCVAVVAIPVGAIALLTLYRCLTHAGHDDPLLGPRTRLVRSETRIGALARIGALFHRGGDSPERRALVRQISQKKQEVAVATALAKKEEVAAAKNHRTSFRGKAPEFQAALAKKVEKADELQALERQLQQLDSGEVALEPAEPEARTTTSSTTAGS